MFIDPVHTTLEEFENAALFLRLGLTSTLIHDENGAFRKCSSNRRNLKTPALRFSVNDGVTIIRWFPVPARVFFFFQPQNQKWPVIDYVFKFLWRSVDRALSLNGAVAFRCFRSCTHKPNAFWGTFMFAKTFIWLTRRFPGLPCACADWSATSLTATVIGWNIFSDDTLMVIIGSLRIDDVRTTAPLGHLIVSRRRPVEIWIYDSQ